MKKLGFAVLVFIIAFAVPVTVYTLMKEEEDLDTRDRAADSTVESGNSSQPEFASIPITEASIGQPYSYKVRAVDDDGDELELRVRQLPEWLVWDEDLGVISGTPSESDAGSHRVEISVSDGKWVQTQTFDVVVHGEDEESGVLLDSEEVVSEETDMGQSSGGVVEEESTADDMSSAETEQDSELLPISEPDGVVAAAQETAVLGESSSLPKTAVSKWVIVAAIGFGIMSAGFFLWADGKWDLLAQVQSSVQYNRGKQIAMDMGEGVTVKKRKVRV